MSDQPPVAPGGSNEPQGQANGASGDVVQAIVLGRQDPEVKPEDGTTTAATRGAACSSKPTMKESTKEIPVTI